MRGRGTRSCALVDQSARACLWPSRSLPRWTSWIRGSGNRRAPHPRAEPCRTTRARLRPHRGCNRPPRHSGSWPSRSRGTGTGRTRTSPVCGPRWRRPTRSTGRFRRRSHRRPRRRRRAGRRRRMTEQIAMTSSELSSLVRERAPGAEVPSDEASSSASSPPTADDGPPDRLRGAADLAADLPSRLAARMGGEHAAWTFADPSDAQAWAQAAFEFCTRYCPISHKCRGDECRLHRFEAQALAVTNGRE